MYHDIMDFNFYTIADVADMLKVSPGAVRNLINNQELRAIQIGGRGLWRIEQSALEEYVQKQYAQSAERLEAGQVLLAD